MVHAGVTTGTSATTFSPEDPLTRAQIAAFLWRIEKEPEAPAHTFNDVHSSWQQGPVSWMSHRNITTGTSATTFSPDAPLTRAHLVTFLWRYQNRPAVTIDPLDRSICRADIAAAVAAAVAAAEGICEWELGCLALLPPPLEEPYEFVFKTIERPVCSGLDWFVVNGVWYVPRDPNAAPGQTNPATRLTADAAGNVISYIADPDYWVSADPLPAERRCGQRIIDWDFINQFLVVPNDEVDEVVARIWADVADAPPRLPVVYILPEETVREFCGHQILIDGELHGPTGCVDLLSRAVWISDKGGHVDFNLLLHELAHLIHHRLAKTIELEVPDGCWAFHPERLGTAADGWQDCDHHAGFTCVEDWLRDRYGHGFLNIRATYEYARTHTTVLTC